MCCGKYFGEEKRFRQPEDSVRYMPPNRSESEDIALDREDADAERILEYCEEFGVCVIDSYLPRERVEAIRNDIETLYRGEESLSGVRTHADLGYQHALNVDFDKVDRNSIPAIERLVLEPDFEFTVHEYYDDDDVRYPSNLFIARSFGTEDSPDGVIEDGPPYALHYDKQNKFKYFFYLTDVTADDGATRFAPGLHQKVKQRRLDELEQGHDVSELSNTIEDVGGEIVSAVGDAGTLLVFDTDVPHRAGSLAEGHDREVLRIDSYSPAHSGIQESLTSKVRKTVSTLFR